MKTPFLKMDLKWKQLKLENDSKSDDNPKDEEDLKIKTTSKIENDPKINDNPHKNGDDLKMKTIQSQNIFTFLVKIKFLNLFPLQIFQLSLEENLWIEFRSNTFRLTHQHTHSDLHTH